jgi:glycosyltransferase involved in cell wall biosynthesis
VKVIHICNLPIPPAHPDYERVRYHPGRWVLNLALAQQANTDIEPELLVQLPGASRDFETNIEGVPVHFVNAPDRLRSATLFFFDKRRLARRARALTPDIVHAHGTEDAYGLAAQATGLPYVITLQGVSLIMNRVMTTPFASRARAVELTERICLRRARHVIAKSEYIATQLKEQFPHLVIHRIPNTIDPRAFKISEEKEPNVLVFVGMIIPRKGLDLLCDALKIVRLDFPDVTLWVFGDRPDAPSAYEQQIKERLRSTLGERVIFHGAIESLEVARHIAKAAALVAPSREEMFGNQLIEALAVGTHAIVTEGTAMAENVRRFGEGTIVPQEDAQALAQAICAALPIRQSRATAEVRKRILEYMGPETVALQHESLYHELIRERQTAAPL